MAFRYQIVTESPLAELFRQKLFQRVKETQCCEIFSLITPNVPNIWEFRRDKDTFTISFDEDADKQREKIIIESATLDLTDIIVSTVETGLFDYLMTFLLPLSRIPRAELEGRIKAKLAGLQTVLQP